MNLNIIESDLRSLSSETKHKFTEIKQLSERVILQLRTYSGLQGATKSDQNVQSLLEFVLRPFLSACATKNSNLILLALTSIQHIISEFQPIITNNNNNTNNYAQSLAFIIGTLRVTAESNEETVQLKVLQTLSLLFNSVNYKYLSEASVSQSLSLLFRLLKFSETESVLTGASRAVLSQILIIISTSGEFEIAKTSNKIDVNMFNENSLVVTNETIEKASIELSDFSRISFLTLRDIVMLINGESALYIQINSKIPAADGIEIVGQLLEATPSVFKLSTPFFLLLKFKICPMLNHHLRLCARESIEFYFLLRLIRTTFVVITNFYEILVKECEYFLSVFLRLLTSNSLQHSALTLDGFRFFGTNFSIWYFIFEKYDIKSKISLFYNIINALTSFIHSFDLNSQHANSPQKTLPIDKFWSFVLSQFSKQGPLDSLSEHHFPSFWNQTYLLPSLSTKTLFNYITAFSNSNYVPKESAIFTKMLENSSISIISCLSYLISIIQQYDNEQDSSSHYDLVFHHYHLYAITCFSNGLKTPQMDKIYNNIVNSICSFLIPPKNSVSKSHKFQYFHFKTLELLFSLILEKKASENLTSSEWLAILETLDHLNRLLFDPINGCEIVDKMRIIFHTSITSFYSSTEKFDDEDIHFFLSSLSTLILSSFANIATNDDPDNDDSSVDLNNLLHSAPFSSPSSIKLFPFSTFLHILQMNMHRIAILFDILVDHLHCMFNHPFLHIRQLASASYERIVMETINIYTSKDTEFICALQNKLFSALPKLYLSKYEDTHTLLILSLLRVIQLVGHNIISGWDYFCELLLNAVSAKSPSPTAISLPVQVTDPHLISHSFHLIQIISTDFIENVTSTCQSAMNFVNILYSYASLQGIDTNISYASIELLWNVSDHLLRNISQDSSTELDSSMDRSTISGWKDALYHLYFQLYSLASDKRADVRHSAIKTLFLILQTQGKRLSNLCNSQSKDNIWSKTLHNILFELLSLSSSSLKELDSAEQTTKLGKQKETGKVILLMVHHSRDSAKKLWIETSSLILSSYSKLFITYSSLFNSLPSYMDDFKFYINILKFHITHHRHNEIILTILNSIQELFTSNITFSFSMLEVLCKLVDLFSKKMLDSAISEESLFDSPYTHFFSSLLCLTNSLFSTNNNSLRKLLSSSQVIHLVHLMTDILYHFHSSSSNHIKYMHPCHRSLISLLEYSATMNILKDDPDGDKCRLTLDILSDIISSINETIPPTSLPDHHKLIKCPHSHCSSSLKHNSILTFTELAITSITNIFSHSLVSIRIDFFETLLHSIELALPSNLASTSASLTSSLIKCLIDIIPIGLDDLSSYSSITTWHTLFNIFSHFLSVSTTNILDESADLGESDRINITVENMQILVLQLIQQDVLPRSDGCPDDIKQMIMHLFDCGWFNNNSSLKSSLRHACLQSLFLLVSHPNNSVAYLASIVLLERCNKLFQSFISDEEEKNPLPLSRKEELFYVLDQLSKNELNPFIAKKYSQKYVNKNITRVLLCKTYSSLVDFMGSNHSDIRDIVKQLLHLIGKEVELE